MQGQHGAIMRARHTGMLFSFAATVAVMTERQRKEKEGAVAAGTPAAKHWPGVERKAVAGHFNDPALLPHR